MGAGGQVYLPPTAELLQGDIYRDVPSIHLPSRPVSITRPYKEVAGHVLHGIHSEDGPAPKHGFRWRPDQGGENVLARGFHGMAIVLTHDCEIENDPDHRLVAQIRPLTEIQEAHRTDIQELRHWAAFPLPANDDPAIEASFVDFRRITSIRPEALRGADRFARLEPIVLDALRIRFWQFLNRRVVEPPGAVPP